MFTRRMMELRPGHWLYIELDLKRKKYVLTVREVTLTGDVTRVNHTFAHATREGTLETFYKIEQYLKGIGCVERPLCSDKDACVRSFVREQTALDSGFPGPALKAKRKRSKGRARGLA